MSIVFKAASKEVEAPSGQHAAMGLAALDVTHKHSTTSVPHAGDLNHFTLHTESHGDHAKKNHAERGHWLDWLREDASFESAKVKVDDLMRKGLMAVKTYLDLPFGHLRDALANVPSVGRNRPKHIHLDHD